MTILEALASGKPFSRPAISAIFDPHQQSYQLTRADLLAGDWTTQSAMVEVDSDTLSNLMDLAGVTDLAQVAAAVKATPIHVKPVTP